MPRKPTQKALSARASLIQLLKSHKGSDPVPPVRELGERFGVNAATIFRILRDLTLEGVTWQSPSGRFHLNAAQSKTLRGAPLCFVGRKMTHWNRLYQEILEGVAEVCAANQSPLVLLSAPSLLRQASPAAAPVFTKPGRQTSELKALIQQSPKGTAGWILDHLWLDSVIQKYAWPTRNKVQVVHGSAQNIPLSGPDYAHAAQLALRHVRDHAYDAVFVLRPFRGDPAIDAATDLLVQCLEAHEVQEIESHQLPAVLRKLSLSKVSRTCILCTEDNILLTTANTIRSSHGPDGGIHLFATQGTGLITSPYSRLRIDYRRVGRKAASSILHGTSLSLEKATLLD